MQWADISKWTSFNRLAMMVQWVLAAVTMNIVRDQWANEIYRKNNV